MGTEILGQKTDDKLGQIHVSHTKGSYGLT